MADNFYNDEFEQFLQQEVKQHRLYPNDRVWQNINKNLHGHKRWPGLTIAGLFLLVSVVAVSVYFQPNPSLFALNPVEHKPNNNVLVTTNAKTNPLIIQPGKTIAFDATENLFDASVETALAQINTSTPTLEVVAPNAPSLPLIQPINNANDFVEPIVSAANAQKNTIHTTVDVLPDNFQTATTTASIVTETTVTAITKNEVVVKPKRTDETGEKNAVDKFLAEQTDLAAILKQSKPNDHKKWNFHFYATPSQSYRRLNEDQNFEKAHAALINSAFTFNTPGNLNNAAKHKPALGMEIGAGISYNINDRIRLKTGLQFNLRQYKIDAYLSSTELTTISLLTDNALNAFSVYRTSNGNQQIELTNKYYQLSIPVGFEWDAISKSKFRWTLAAAIQPSYQLNRNALLMSTDYKNYTQSPSLLRTWNINSSLETFVSYTIGDYRWQIGPQIRYQHLPTFNKKYPIRENLLDYGLKIGFSKVIQ